MRAACTKVSDVLFDTEVHIAGAAVRAQHGVVKEGCSACHCVWIRLYELISASMLHVGTKRLIVSDDHLDIRLNDSKCRIIRIFLLFC